MFTAGSINSKSGGKNSRPDIRKRGNCAIFPTLSSFRDFRIKPWTKAIVTFKTQALRLRVSCWILSPAKSFLMRARLRAERPIIWQNGCRTRGSLWHAITNRDASVSWRKIWPSSVLRLRASFVTIGQKEMLHSNSPPSASSTAYWSMRLALTPG